MLSCSISWTWHTAFTLALVVPPSTPAKAGTWLPHSVSYSTFPSQGVILYSLNELSPFCL